MAVAASQAALLLAQGAGRPLRTMEDRGMVAILDRGGHRPLRRLPAGVAAAVLDHHRPGSSPGRAPPPGRPDFDA